MTDTALFRWLPSAGTQPREATAPDRPRPRGPVLMGDLHASLGGRPVFLMHWDAPEDG